MGGKEVQKSEEPVAPIPEDVDLDDDNIFEGLHSTSDDN